MGDPEAEAAHHLNKSITSQVLKEVSLTISDRTLLVQDFLDDPNKMPLPKNRLVKDFRNYWSFFVYAVDCDFNQLIKNWVITLSCYC